MKQHYLKQETVPQLKHLWRKNIEELKLLNLE